MADKCPQCRSVDVLGGLDQKTCLTCGKSWIESGEPASTEVRSGPPRPANSAGDRDTDIVLGPDGDVDEAVAYARFHWENGDGMSRSHQEHVEGNLELLAEADLGKDADLTELVGVGLGDDREPEPSPIPFIPEEQRGHKGDPENVAVENPVREPEPEPEPAPKAAPAPAAKKAAASTAKKS